MIIFKEKENEKDLFIDVTKFKINGNKNIIWFEGINCTGKTTYAKRFTDYTILEAGDISQHLNSKTPYVDRYYEILKIVKENPDEKFLIIRSPLSALAYNNEHYIDPFKFTAKFRPHLIYLFEPSSNYKSLEDFYEAVKSGTQRKLDEEDLDVYLNGQALIKYKELIGRFIELDF